IGVVIEDKEYVESLMNGKPWKAGKFSHSLRCSLWSEHLGLHTGEINKITDPVADSTYKDLWKILESTMKSLLAFPMIKYTQGAHLSQFSSV
ncbi:phospholipase D p1-like protein, partial [Trifolium pratense]